MKEQEQQKWQTSTKEQRTMGVSFLKKVFELLGLGSGFTEEMLDFVLRELYDYEGYYVSSIPADQYAEEEYFDNQQEAFRKIKDRKKGIIEELTDLLEIKEEADEIAF